ncbi:ABC transporter permease [Natranaerobius trueperi]|uniref:ABC transporter permease n=1 Tax=Natranaerobius trueperi TaxID=759412 RepID=A0A226C0T3_9FIRM|nr:ABC transporter permease subunit [Natranaerobius trueperi]OWZ84836.1 ABC transporter permease [Natranaerobius trueperi]
MKTSITKDNKPISKLTSKKGIYKTLIIGFWLVVWQIVYLIIQQDIYLPSPIDVTGQFFKLLFTSSFWVSVIYSIYRVMLGLLLSIGCGVVFGALASTNRYFYDLLQPLVSAIRSTPVISFIIIALIWFTSSNVPIFICFLMCFPIFWTNILEGIHSVDRKLLEMATVYRVNKWDIIKKIYIPSITPYFTAATITALGLGFKVSVAAEVLSNPREGIGSHLYSAKVYLDSIDMFSWTLVVILLTISFEGLFTWLVKKVSVSNNK